VTTRKNINKKSADSGKKCYLCGSHKYRKRTGKVRDNENIEILECISCGLVYLSSFEHIKEGFYEFSGMHEDKDTDIEAWINETKWDDDRRFKWMKDKIKGKNILDFGCGTGGFLLEAGKIASRAVGVEPEKRLVDHFIVNGLKVYPNIRKTEGRYDIITLFHVLEHIADPAEKLLKLAKFLRPKGEIIIEVPNADDALITLYENKAFMEFTYWSCHLYLFTVKTLGDLIRKTGLKVNYIRQLQRYPLSNHLYWLAKGKPGGHLKWDFLDTDDTRRNYERLLADMEKCDTLIASVGK